MKLYGSLDPDRTPSGNKSTIDISISIQIHLPPIGLEMNEFKMEES